MQLKQHWENVYQQKQPTEVSWFQIHPELSLKLIQSIGITQDQPIIDVGGGASCLVDKLLDAGYQDITVLDIAAAALAHTQSRLGSSAAQVTWLENDITTFTPAKQYGLWHDRAVFHFLTNAEDQLCYLASMQRALPLGAYAIIATFSLDGPERCSDLPVERYDEAKLQSTIGNSFKLLQAHSEAHTTPTNKIQYFIWFILQRITPHTV